MTKARHEQLCIWSRAEIVRALQAAAEQRGVEIEFVDRGPASSLEEAAANLGLQPREIVTSYVRHFCKLQSDYCRNTTLCFAAKLGLFHDCHVLHMILHHCGGFCILSRLLPVSRTRPQPISSPANA